MRYKSVGFTKTLRASLAENSLESNTHRKYFIQWVVHRTVLHLNISINYKSSEKSCVCSWNIYFRIECRVLDRRDNKQLQFFLEPYYLRCLQREFSISFLIAKSEVLMLGQQNPGIAISSWIWTSSWDLNPSNGAQRVMH